MDSSNSNTASVPTETSPLPKAWLAELHKDFEAKIKATEQHEQLQAAARSKRRPKKRKSAQPVNAKDDDLKPLVVSTATSAETEVTQKPATKAHKPSQKHRTKLTKHNDLSDKANGVLAVHKDTSGNGDSALAVTEQHQVLQAAPSTASLAIMPGNVHGPEALLIELRRRKNDEERTIPSEDEQKARDSHSKRLRKRLSRNAQQGKPTTVISTASDNNSIPTTPAFLPDMSKAQEVFTVADSVPAMSRVEQSVTECHKISSPEISPKVTNDCQGVTRPSSSDLHDTKASKPRYDVEELKAIGKSCMSGRLRLWDVEQDLQHIHTKSSAVTLRAFAQYQSTLDQPVAPEEVRTHSPDSAKLLVNQKLVHEGPGSHSHLASTRVDSGQVAVADPWTSAEVVEKPAVPIVLLGLAARARTRKEVLQIGVPAKPYNEDTEKAKAAVQPPRIGPSRRNKGATSKGKLRYKPGEKAPELLDLPFEVQTTIIEYALLQDENIHVDALFRTLNKKPGEFKRRGYGALFVCHHFHKIGREAYYSINTFTMSLGLWISLEKLMTRWPNIPRFANNIQPALMHMKHVIVSQLGPGEHAPTYAGLWRHLVQFLRPFQHLEVVEIDLRYVGNGFRAEDELNDRIAPVPEGLRLRLQKAGGIRIGWTKKESEMTGIKKGALMCRASKGMTEGWIQASLSQVIDALQ